MTSATLNRGLLAFDKLNIALCAKQRALQTCTTSERFEGEYDTAHLWMRHSLHTMGDCHWSY